MRFQFKSKTLSNLYYYEKGSKAYPSEVVDAFFETMMVIEGAVNENDLRAFKSLHFEKLQGNRTGQHSVRLHGGFRLILTIGSDVDGKLIWIIEIVNYH